MITLCSLSCIDHLHSEMCPLPIPVPTILQFTHQLVTFCPYFLYCYIPCRYIGTLLKGLPKLRKVRKKNFSLNRSTSMLSKRKTFVYCKQKCVRYWEYYLHVVAYYRLDWLQRHLSHYILHLLCNVTRNKEYNGLLYNIIPFLS